MCDPYAINGVRYLTILGQGFMDASTHDINDTKSGSKSVKPWPHHTKPARHVSIAFPLLILSYSSNFWFSRLRRYHCLWNIRWPTALKHLWNSLNWGASFWWSFGPNSAWGSLETTPIVNMHPSLVNPKWLIILNRMTFWFKIAFGHEKAFISFKSTFFIN